MMLRFSSGSARAKFANRAASTLFATSHFTTRTAKQQTTCATIHHQQQQLRHYCTGATETDPFDQQTVEKSYQASTDAEFDDSFKTRHHEATIGKAAGAAFEKLPGDWHCPTCGFLNFRRQKSCRMCGVGQRPSTRTHGEVEPAPRGGGIGGGGGGMAKAATADWVCSCGMRNTALVSACTGCQLPRAAKSGDWQCQCGKTNYQSAMQCAACGGSKNADTVKTIIESTDWICSKCKTHNFKRRDTCRECLAPRAGNEVSHEDANVAVIQRKPTEQLGDWACPRCSFVNFRSRAECLKCLERRPVANTAMRNVIGGGAIGDGGSPRGVQRVLPGDWTCPKCGVNNFSSRKACFKCKTERPDHSGGTV